jgi:hypothetical protein
MTRTVTHRDSRTQSALDPELRYVKVHGGSRSSLRQHQPQQQVSGGSVSGVSREA